MMETEFAKDELGNPTNTILSLKFEIHSLAGDFVRSISSLTSSSAVDKFYDWVDKHLDEVKQAAMVTPSTADATTVEDSISAAHRVSDSDEDAKSSEEKMIESGPQNPAQDATENKSKRGNKIK